MNDGLCGADRTRWRAPRGYASAAGTRARVRGAGCWAGRSACPWPRQSLLVGLAPTRSPCLTGIALSAVGKLGVLLSRRGPRNEPDRSRIATCGRLFEGTDEISPGQTCSQTPGPASAHSPAARQQHHIHLSSHAGLERLSQTDLRFRAMLQNCWHSERKLLASGKADSTPERRKTTKRGSSSRSRAHHVNPRSDELRPLAASVVDSGQRRTPAFPQPVDNFVDSSSLLCGRPRVGR